MGDDPHPNLVKAQATSGRTRESEIAGLDDQADGIMVENAPVAEPPWRVVEGKGAFVNFVLQFVSFKGTWHQDGRCIYADDRCTISLVHETGSSPNSDAFDNMAIWITRIDADGKNDRLWTVDLDQEHVTAFWVRNEAALEEFLSTQ